MLMSENPEAIQTKYMVSGETVTLNSTTWKDKMVKCRPQETVQGSSMNELKGRKGGKAENLRIKA